MCDKYNANYALSFWGSQTVRQVLSVLYSCYSVCIYVNVNVNVNVNVQYFSTRESCNKELRRLRHEGCLQQTTELC